MTTSDGLRYIDSHPIYVHSQLAKALGLVEAILLGRLAFWLTQNKIKKSKDHYRDGLWWSKNTLAEWQRSDFPFLSVETIKRGFDYLVELKLVTFETTKYEPGYEVSKIKWWTINADHYNAFFDLWDTYGQPLANEKKKKGEFSHTEFIEQWKQIIYSTGQNDPSTGQDDLSKTGQNDPSTGQDDPSGQVRMTHHTESPENRRESSDVNESVDSLISADTDVEAKVTIPNVTVATDSVLDKPMGAANGRRLSRLTKNGNGLHSAPPRNTPPKTKKTPKAEQEVDPVRQKVAALKKAILSIWGKQLKGNAFVVAQEMAEQMAGVSQVSVRCDYNFDPPIQDVEQIDRFVEWYYETYDEDTSLPIRAQALARQFGMFWSSQVTNDDEDDEDAQDRADRYEDDRLFEQDFPAWVNKHILLAEKMTEAEKRARIWSVFIEIAPRDREGWRKIIQQRLGLDPVEVVNANEKLTGDLKYQIDWQY